MSYDQVILLVHAVQRVYQNCGEAYLDEATSTHLLTTATEAAHACCWTHPGVGGKQVRRDRTLNVELAEIAADEGKQVKERLKKGQAIALRLFLIYCVVYTVVSVLFDYQVAKYTGISETACPALFIDAKSEEELKQRLIDEFSPTFVFAFGEPANLDEEVIVPYQFVPDQQDTGRYVWRGAVAYPMDYGATSFGVRLSIGTDGYSIALSKTVLRSIGWIFGQAHVDAHIGDAEMFELYLKPSEKEGYWEIDSLSTFPHGNRRTYTANEVHCFRDSPILYISRGKHAMYPSLRECNNSSVANRRGVHLTAEHCSVGELYYPSISPEFNVGDSTNPINIFETSPTLIENEIFQGEDAWGSCFFGGNGNDDLQNKPCRSRFRWW